MINKEGQTKARITLVLGAIMILTVIAAVFNLTWPVLLVQAGPTLPSREEPSPSAPPDSDEEQKSDTGSIGAFIELQVHAAEVNLWAVVQWQDSAGAWHNVEGWQGSVDSAGNKRWWVAAKDFSAGPFRWVVTTSPEEEPLAISEPFRLPDQANEVMQVEVFLER